MAAAPAVGIYMKGYIEIFVSTVSSNRPFSWPFCWRLILGLGLLAYGSTSFATTTYIAVVQGLSGEDYYQSQFQEQVDAIQKASEEVSSSTQVRLFSGDQATGAQLLDWLQVVANDSTAEDRVALFYIGHGSYAEEQYKFNLVGPDLTGEELKASLAEINAELKLLVNTSSSSGALLALFEDQPNTILLLATKSGGERNAPRFGRFFVRSLADEEADLDKNQLVSAKEAFEYAERQTQDFYTSEGLIETEHGVLQGEHANLFSLARLSGKSTAELRPEFSALYDQRDQIDLEIERLRMRRIGMSDQDYMQEFQSLLIRLSLLQAEIDDMEAVDESEADVP